LACSLWEYVLWPRVLGRFANVLRHSDGEMLYNVPVHAEYEVLREMFCKREMQDLA